MWLKPVPTVIMGVLTMVAVPAASEAASERFYGREAFTIVYVQDGAEAGRVTEHVRDWGRRRAEIVRTTTKVSTVVIEKDNRMVSEGAKVATIDNRTGRISTIVNPMYDRIVASMQGRPGTEFGEQIMRAMGATKTGSTGSFAGQSCAYWTLASAGLRTCVTDWGATLHVAASLGPVSYERKAVEVRVGDGGPDAAFAYDASKATAGPDLDALMQRAREGRRPRQNPN